MKKLPYHNASQFFHLGMVLKQINSIENDYAPITYAHQDDYYILGMVESGKGCGIIDLKECRITSGYIFLIQPGQIHRFLNSENVKGWMLMVDSKFVGCVEKCIFDKFSLYASSFNIDKQHEAELKQIIILLNNRISHVNDKLSKEIVARLAESFIGIIAETIQHLNIQHLKFSQRHVEIVVSFRHLLAEHISASRKPSYYASHLNISTVYLNEVVKEITGMSSSLYIKNEMVLQAKRMLVYSNLSVKEIAFRLGIDDYAYFSRLFTQSTGINPTSFRQKYLE